MNMFSVMAIGVAAAIAAIAPSSAQAQPAVSVAAISGAGFAGDRVTVARHRTVVRTNGRHHYRTRRVCRTVYRNHRRIRQCRTVRAYR